MNKILPTIKYEQLVSKAVERISNQRAREIIRQRFGLEDGQRKTLEAIGQKYGITRERVRQVEEAAFSVLRKNNFFDFFQPALRPINDFFDQSGQAVIEEKLLSFLANAKHPHPGRGAVFFILTVLSPYERFAETDRFYPFWTNSKNVWPKAQEMIKALIKDLEREGKVVSGDYLLDIGRKKISGLSEQALFSYLDITKEISQNCFGQFGLSAWPEINPRGVKDKAFLVFKKENRPLHFRAAADLINQYNFGSRLAHPQTVHNELIKDPRFVLVGRGIYALTDWGYQPGTILELIKGALKENGPLAKDEILKGVLKHRLVKENTVLINLQNRKWFVRDEEGRYSLK